MPAEAGAGGTCFIASVSYESIACGGSLRPPSEPILPASQIDLPKEPRVVLRSCTGAVPLRAEAAKKLLSAVHSVV